MAYILRNFDRVSVTTSFEEMGRNNVELGTFERACVAFCRPAPPLLSDSLTRVSWSLVGFSLRGAASS